MQNITHLSELLHQEISALPEVFQKLAKEARNATKGSYSPYSKFPVGAALLLEDEKVITGANQENAAYPSGLCAERTALFYAGASHPQKKVLALAVAVGNPIDDFPFPCGGCLQVMSEFQEKQSSPIDVLLVHSERDEVLWSKGIHHMLPFAFKKTHLRK